MIILLLILPLLAFSSNEELIELQIAGLTAERIHMQNVLLYGVDPSTCKSTDNPRILVKQMQNISKTGLSHCTQTIQAKLHAIDEKIKRLEQGELTFSPSKTSPTPLIPEQNFKAPEVASVEKNSDGEEEISWPELGATTERVISPEAQDRHQMMIDYYTSNRTMYESQEDDSLFEKISKGYKRNLHKMEPGN